MARTDDDSWDLRTVGVDLRQDWPKALRESGFDRSQPTAWSAEGLLIGFLPGEAQDRLIDGITALSAPGSRLAADHLPGQTESMAPHMQALGQRWKEHGLDVDLGELTYTGEHNDLQAYLQGRGWDVMGMSLDDLFQAAGIAVPQLGGIPGAPITIQYVAATRR
jgi:methyltransferase (TIGR00027 family)